MYVNTGIPNMIKTGRGLRPKLDVRSNNHHEIKPRLAKVGVLPESGFVRMFDMLHAAWQKSIYRR